MIRIKAKALVPTTVYLTLETYDNETTLAKNKGKPKEEWVLYFKHEVQALCFDNVLGQWVGITLEEADLPALEAAGLSVRRGR